MLRLKKSHRLQVDFSAFFLHPNRSVYYNKAAPEALRNFLPIPAYFRRFPAHYFDRGSHTGPFAPPPQDKNAAAPLGAAAPIPGK